MTQLPTKCFITDKTGRVTSASEEGLDLREMVHEVAGVESLDALILHLSKTEFCFTSSSSNQSPSYQLVVKPLFFGEQRLLWCFYDSAAGMNFEAVLGSQALFQNILESAPDATVLVDGKGQIKITNKQTKRLFGYSKSELIGAPVEKLMPDGYHQAHKAHRKSFLVSPRFRNMGENLDLLGKRKDGGEFPVEISLSPIYVGDETWVAASIRDASQRKKSEAKESELRSNLEALNNELESFAYIVSHDLKAPLRSMGTLIEWIVEDDLENLGQDSKKHFSMVQGQLKKMHGLIDGILEYSRIGRTYVDQKPVDVQQIVTDIMEYYVGNEEVELKTQGDFPTLVANPTLVHQLFQNLISNAVKALDNNPGIVQVVYSKELDYHTFKVIDNGKGIAPKHHERIFKIFQTLGDQSDGTGVGLTIVKKIIDQLQGKIDLKSELGKGTEFTVSIPINSA